MSDRLSRFCLIAAIGIVALAASPVARAVPTLMLFDGTNTMVITDQMLHDSSSAVGQVTFVGTIGSWTISLTTGTTKPALGSATSPSMTITSMVATSHGSGTLTVSFSDTNYAPPSSATTYKDMFNSSIGGTVGSKTAGSITYKTYASNANTLFGTTKQLTSSGPFGPGSFSGAATGHSVFLSDFSLTQQVTIVHTKSGTSSFNATLTGTPVKVPDSGSYVVLLGIAFAGVEGLRRAFRGDRGVSKQTNSPSRPGLG